MSPFQEQNASSTAGNATGSSTPRNAQTQDLLSNALPPLGAIGEQPRRSSQDATDGNTLHTAGSRMSVSERNARQYEELLALQRRVQAQISLIDPETRREVDEVQALEDDITRYRSADLSGTATPTNDMAHLKTHNPSSSSASSSSNFKRYSLSTMPSTSAAFSNSRRTSHSGSQVVSPYNDPRASVSNMTQPLGGHIAPQSVPGSDQNSDVEASDEDHAPALSSYRPKAGANPNRNSMPVTAFDLRNQSYGIPTPPASFAFFNNRGYPQTEKEKDISTHSPLRPSQHGPTSPDPSTTFLQLHQTDDKFPILVRRETDKGPQLPTVAAFNDRAAMTQRSPELAGLTDRATASRHRQSLPPSAMRHSIAGLGDSLLDDAGAYSDALTAKNTAANRHSLEIAFPNLGDNLQAKSPQTSVPGQDMPSAPRMLSSHSTNDIPTLKGRVTSPPTHKDNATGAMPLGTSSKPGLTGGYGSDNVISPLIGSDPRTDASQATSLAITSPQLQTYNYGGYGLPTVPPTLTAQPLQSPQYGNYGMPMLPNSFSTMNITGQATPWNGQVPMYQGAQAGLSQYTYQGNARAPDSGARSGVQRRGQTADDSRYAAVSIEALVGEIYGLCKDQHGCRFLQKKLEERNPAHLELIFKETNPHVIELMTDPFGNYLCQKLLEHANEEQRTTMIRCASPQMVKIALNQHGTRALQKMIESVETEEQIGLIIEGLRNKVIQLIQDLNGNHVIQKCLNVLERNSAQFIYDAVCTHVVTVGTHRHGCCVLQRCIDHASGMQKGQIVAAVTQSAFTLVQDPFGNYVVQYILDLGEPTFSGPLCASFLGNVCVLSRQKFSSNVIEKVLRIADISTRRAMIEEMLVPIEMEKLLRDSFANYVVQTAIEYAEPPIKDRMLALIRPLLPSIRNTPHGRRIQSKLAEFDNRRVGNAPAPINDLAPTGHMQFGGQQNFSRPTFAHNGSNMMPGQGMQGGPYGHSLGGPGPQRNFNGLGQSQPPVGYNSFSSGPRMSQNNAMGYY